MLFITTWNGRFGNNVLQLVRAIHYAVNHNHWEINFPDSGNFSRKVIFLTGSDKKYPGSTSRVHNTFWAATEPPPQLARYYAQKYLVPILNIRTIQQVDCIIHLRGGDIFDEKPHTKYFQPPLSYYKKYVGSQTIMVYEDNKNPCVETLRHLCIRSQSSTFKDDLSTLLAAKHLVIGYSTLAYATFLLSKNLINLTIPSNYAATLPSLDFGSDFKLTIVDLADYFNGEDWSNNETQIMRMLTY
jgi:hypothetical protein